MKTFNELLSTKSELFKDIDSDLIEVFKRVLGDDDAEKIEAYDITDKLDYDGSIHEVIDGRIEIYNYELRQWAVDNYTYVEDAIDQGLCDGTDYHKSIQSGQYLKLSEDMNESINELSNAIDEAL